MRVRTVTYLITLAVVSIDCRSLSENVTKSDQKQPGDLFPDWVPFKNKHGEELGEFLQVPVKKPKKRLAMPLNFALRSISEPEPEDYFEKGQGESEGEDYFERREWAEASGPSALSKQQPPPVKHTELSDIDGVIGIITKHLPQKTEIKKEPQEKRRSRKPSTRKPKPRKILEYPDDEEEPEKSKSTLSEERNESDLRKSQILDSVDDLKERHAMEQKVISEKIKEEAMYNEERERDIIKGDKFDKYNNNKAKLSDEKSEYEEYDDKLSGDKYKFDSQRKPTPTTPSHTSSTETSTTESTTTQKDPITGRLSVFRNPSVYMVYDEDTSSSTSTETSTETTPTTSKTSTTFKTSTTKRVNPTKRRKQTKSNTKYSAKMTSEPPKAKSDERISLVPQDNELREGEPTLFFPKKRRKSLHRKNETGKITDSQVAGSDHEPELILSLRGLNDTSETGPSGTGPGADISTTAGSASSETVVPLKNAPSASSEENHSSAESSEVNQTKSLADVISASSDHKEEKKKDGNYEHKKGGETEHHSEHFSEHGESGRKAYEGEHEDTKTSKGHHDKEDHLGKYSDHGGIDKSHHDEKEHYGDHHHEEHGKKHAKYEESGKHSKGHSTKGSHDIHKKEEYEKKVEFFEEEGDSAEEEKHGGHSEDRGHKEGGHFKKADADAGYHDHAKGDSGQFNKFGHVQNHKEHNSAAGHDSHGKHGATRATKTASAGGKKWIYHHGFPAKSANLVVIDRRSDQLYHGPQYYG